MWTTSRSPELQSCWGEEIREDLNEVSVKLFETKIEKEKTDTPYITKEMKKMNKNLLLSSPVTVQWRP